MYCEAVHYDLSTDVEQKQYLLGDFEQLQIILQNHGENKVCIDELGTESLMSRTSTIVACIGTTLY